VKKCFYVEEKSHGIWEFINIKWRGTAIRVGCGRSGGMRGRERHAESATNIAGRQFGAGGGTVL